MADNRYPPGFRPETTPPKAPAGAEPTSTPSVEKSSAQAKAPSYMYPPGFEPQQPTTEQEQPVQSPAEETSTPQQTPSSESQQRPVPAAPFHRPGPRASDSADGGSSVAAGPASVPISADQMPVPTSRDIEALLPPRAATHSGAPGQAFVSPALAQQVPLPVEGGPIGMPISSGGSTDAGVLAGDAIAIPTEGGGVVAVRDHAKTVEYDGEEVELRQLTPEEKRRRRLIKNLVMAALGILFLIVTALILINL